MFARIKLVLFVFYFNFRAVIYSERPCVRENEIGQIEANFGEKKKGN